MKELTSKITKLIVENEKTNKIVTKLDQIIRQFNTKEEMEIENNDIINKLPLATEEDVFEMERFLSQKKNEKKMVS